MYQEMNLVNILRRWSTLGVLRKEIWLCPRLDNMTTDFKKQQAKENNCDFVALITFSRVTKALRCIFHPNDRRAPWSKRR